VCVCVCVCVWSSVGNGSVPVGPVVRLVHPIKAPLPQIPFLFSALGGITVKLQMLVFMVCFRPLLFDPDKGIIVAALIGILFGIAATAGGGGVPAAATMTLATSFLVLLFVFIKLVFQLFYRRIELKENQTLRSTGHDIIVTAPRESNKKNKEKGSKKKSEDIRGRTRGFGPATVQFRVWA